MRRLAFVFFVLLSVLTGGLVSPPRAEGTIFRGAGFRPYQSRMPGWDWWRIYPYSPYNYGRNPYNPIVAGYYPYVSPYPYPTYAQPASAPSSPAYVYPGASEPTVSGPLPTPPPGSALIRVRVPDMWAKVQFDGEDTSNMGLRRTFVTPELPDGKTYSYNMTVTWTRNGKSMRDERVVRVRAGQIREIDLARPEPTS